MPGHTSENDDRPEVAMRAGSTRGSTAGGWLRFLAMLLLVYEPAGFAAAAAGAMNAVQVRGIGVVLVLTARLLATSLSVAAGVALLNGHGAGVVLARAALVCSATVQVFASLSPLYPSNRMPGDAPIQVGVILAYYACWLVYLSRSTRVSRFHD